MGETIEVEELLKFLRSKETQEDMKEFLIKQLTPFYEKAKEEGKRLGALGELELMYKYVSTTSNGGRKHLLKKIKERLKELEK